VSWGSAHVPQQCLTEYSLYFFFLSESHRGLQHLEKHPAALTPWEDVLLKCKWIPAYVLTSQDGVEKYNRELRSWWISGNNNRKKPQRTPNLLALISMHWQSTASLSCSAAPCPCSCWGWAASQQCAVAAAFGAAAQHPRGNGLLLCPSSSAASRSSHSCILSPAFPFLFFFFFFFFLKAYPGFCSALSPPSSVPAAQGSLLLSVLERGVSLLHPPCADAHQWLIQQPCWRTATSILLVGWEVSRVLVLWIKITHLHQRFEFRGIISLKMTKQNKSITN